MRGRLSIPRSRRGLLVDAALLAVIAGAVAGTIVAVTRGDSGLTKASFRGYGFEFSYPSDWKSIEWCWQATEYFPLTLLTTAGYPPTCEPTTIFGYGTPLPPPQELGPNGVTVWWSAAARPAFAGEKADATVGGRPARVSVRTSSTRRTARSLVNCPGKDATQRVVTALIEGTAPGARRIAMGAVVCGPDFEAGTTDVRRMLDSVRFTS